MPRKGTEFINSVPKRTLQSRAFAKWFWHESRELGGRPQGGSLNAFPRRSVLVDVGLRQSRGRRARGRSRHSLSGQESSTGSTARKLGGILHGRPGRLRHGQRTLAKLGRV